MQNELRNFDSNNNSNEFRGFKNYSNGRKFSQFKSMKSKERTAFAFSTEGAHDYIAPEVIRQKRYFKKINKWP